MDRFASNRRHAANYRLSFLLGCILAVEGCAATVADPTGLATAKRNYPPLVIVGTVHPADGSIPRACPAPGGRVEQKGGPTLEFLGADASNPDLCQIRVAGDTAMAWYGIWLTDWPGAADAYPALRQVMHDGTGAIAGFDTIMNQQRRYHDFVRNEGVEDLTLLGKTYRAMKLSHYREGFGDNLYRSVSTVWKDIPTGLLIYGTYQHISGTPELDDPLIPTAIVAGP